MVVGPAGEVALLGAGDDLADPGQVDRDPVVRLGIVGEASAVDLAGDAFPNRRSERETARFDDQRVAFDDQFALFDAEDPRSADPALIQRLQRVLEFADPAVDIEDVEVVVRSSSTATACLHLSSGIVVGLAAGSEGAGRLRHMTTMRARRSVPGGIGGIRGLIEVSRFIVVGRRIISVRDLGHNHDRFAAAGPEGE